MSEENKDKEEEQKSEEKPQGDQPKESKTNKIGFGKKVLVVDDDTGAQELLRKILESEEFEVFTTADGAEGLKIANSERPELIIADVLMPAMGGLDFFKEIKKAKQTEKIQILITSVRSKMEDSFLALGAQGFVPKPIDTAKLLEMIGNLTLIEIPLLMDDEEEGGEEGSEEGKEEGGEEKKE